MRSKVARGSTRSQCRAGACDGQGGPSRVGYRGPSRVGYRGPSRVGYRAEAPIHVGVRFKVVYRLHLGSGLSAAPLIAGLENSLLQY